MSTKRIKPQTLRVLGRITPAQREHAEAVVKQRELFRMAMQLKHMWQANQAASIRRGTR